MYKFTVINDQSPWLPEVYNAILPFKTNGFLVEIGVGHTLEGPHYQQRTDPSLGRCGSNTADLLDLGWSGIYIDPVKEYCIEATLSHKNNLDRLKIINNGCSDIEEEATIYFGDTFAYNNKQDSRYEWLGRKVKCFPAKKILSENNCPQDIDIMSIDVEGYELKVLQGMDFNLHSPKIIIVEINQVGTTAVHNLLPGYNLYRQDTLNAVFVRK